MTFGWQGFTLEHPDDWAPVQLTGRREEGYVRIASPSRISCQVRWQKAPPQTDLGARLKNYLTKLEKDAKRAKAEFDADLDTEDGRLTYRYRGTAFARGTLFYAPEDERVFFVEIVSTKNESLKPAFNEFLSGFRCEGQDRWALLGLNVVLPAGLRVEHSRLEAGHIRLDLVRRGVRVVAERWGFGEQLLAKHGLAPWAREALKLPKAKATEEPGRVRLWKGGILPTEALVQYQPDRNQLIALSVRTRLKDWRPKWDSIV